MIQIIGNLIGGIALLLGLIQTVKYFKYTERKLKK